MVVGKIENRDIQYKDLICVICTVNPGFYPMTHKCQCINAICINCGIKLKDQGTNDCPTCRQANAIMWPDSDSTQQQLHDLVVDKCKDHPNYTKHKKVCDKTMKSLERKKKCDELRKKCNELNTCTAET